MPYQRLARHVLEEWRVVERQLSEEGADSEQAALLRSMADALRDEYQHLVEQAVLHDRPVPPPFPEFE